jgi:hypothetical protein
VEQRPVNALAGPPYEGKIEVCWLCCEVYGIEHDGDFRAVLIDPFCCRVCWEPARRITVVEPLAVVRALRERIEELQAEPPPDRAEAFKFPFDKR